VSDIPSDKNYIWTKEHVKNYLSGRSYFIWVLRIYKLKKPYLAEPTPGAIRFANLNEEVSLEDVEPVLSYDQFTKMSKF
jgi:hypothetical protein